MAASTSDSSSITVSRPHPRRPMRGAQSVFGVGTKTVCNRRPGARRTALIDCSGDFTPAWWISARRDRRLDPGIGRGRRSAACGGRIQTVCSRRDSHSSAHRLMTRIGIDIGALFLKAVRLDDEGRIAASVYERHRGEPADVLAEAFDRLNVQPDEPVGLTGCNAEAVRAAAEGALPRRHAVPDRRRPPDGARRVRRDGHRRRVGHAHPARRQGQVPGLLHQLAVRRGHRVVPRRAGGPARHFLRRREGLPAQSRIRRPSPRAARSSRRATSSTGSRRAAAGWTCGRASAAA